MSAVQRKLLTITLSVIGLSVAVLRLLAEVIATASEPRSREDVMNGSLHGGVLNYRTGKLDDGTDPIGWYEPD